MQGVRVGQRQWLEAPYLPRGEGLSFALCAWPHFPHPGKWVPTWPHKDEVSTAAQYRALSGLEVTLTWGPGSGGWVVSLGSLCSCVLCLRKPRDTGLSSFPWCPPTILLLHSALSDSCPRSLGDRLVALDPWGCRWRHSRGEVGCCLRPPRVRSGLY